MKKMIPVPDNLNFGKYSDFESSKIDASELPVRKWYLSDLINTKIIPLKNKDASKEDDLVIEVINDENGNKKCVTGNYIGKFQLKNERSKKETSINIVSRFSGNFLNRMLNVANNVFLQDVRIEGGAGEDKSNFIKYIIGYLFIQQLGKAYLLGFPQSYETIKYHDRRIHGQIDFNSFIRKDMPFIGKISSIKKERVYVTEIVDVLNKAFESIEDIFKNAIHGRLNDVKTLLYQNASKNYVNFETVYKAEKHKSLQNPIYADYKKVLRYAKILLKLHDIDYKTKSKDYFSGYLINAAELWEIYLEKLLKHHLTGEGWSISSQNEIELYENNFYNRKIIPDLVLTTPENKTIVLDAKYKKMLMRNRYKNLGDVDRTDFFQIHTYMSYYKENLIAGGLIYPFEDEYNKTKCYSEEWIGGSAKFIIDGIDLTKTMEENKTSIEQIEHSEKEFIKRIKELSN